MRDSSHLNSDPARSVRRTATGILIALFIVFVSTAIPENPTFWVLFIRAMAEAGMVGGLADWFAVEALFRRPLGLPIPHTALLPANQNRAASNIARFVDEYFLDPDQLLKEIRAIDPIKKLGVWLSVEKNARTIGIELSWALQKLIHSQLNSGIPAPLRAMITDSVTRAAMSGHLADRIAELMQNSLNTRLLDDILQSVRDAILENRPSITRLVQDRSRWWIASGVDRQVATLLIDGVVSVLDELMDHNAPRRAAFAASVGRIIDRFREDGVIEQFLDDSISGHTDSSAFTKAVDDMFDAALRQFDETLSADQDTLHEALSSALQQVGQKIETDIGVRNTITDRLETALVPLLTSMRQPVRSYVMQTIADWDSDQLVERIETEVGRDLQFIRINGAVLGSVLGGLLFLAAHFIF